MFTQKPFHGAQQRCQSYCCLESAPLPLHRTGTGASALTIATMRMGAHLALGASVHITQNTTTTITTARMGARLERARTSPPLRTMTERVHQHHCTRTLTASSSIGVHVSWHHAQGRSTATSSARACARTTEQVSEALPRARVDGYGTSAQRAHKCRYVRSRSGRDGTALCARLAARARHTRLPPGSQEGGRRPSRLAA